MAIDQAKLSIELGEKFGVSELMIPSIEGRWDGARQLSLSGKIGSVGDAQEAGYPADLTLRAGQQGLERISFKLYEISQSEARNTLGSPIANLQFRPQSQTGNIDLNLDQSAQLPLFEESPFADASLEVSGGFQTDSNEIYFEKISGKIGNEAFEGYLNGLIPKEQQAQIFLNLKFGVFDQSLAQAILSKEAVLKEVSVFASKLANLPFELDLGLSAAGVADPNGEVARAPALHFVAGLGSVTMDQFNLSLPGGTELSLLADYIPGEEGRQDWFASGGVSLQSSNIRRSLEWAGIDLSSFDPDILRYARLSAGFEGDASRFLITEFDLGVDENKLVGDAEMAFSATGLPRKLKAKISSPEIDLDDYVEKGFSDSGSDVSTDIGGFFSKLDSLHLAADIGVLKYWDKNHEEVAVSLNLDKQNLGFQLSGLALKEGAIASMKIAADREKLAIKEGSYVDIRFDDFVEFLSMPLSVEKLLVGKELEKGGSAGQVRLSIEPSQRGYGIGLTARLTDHSFVSAGSAELTRTGLVLNFPRGEFRDQTDQIIGDFSTAISASFGGDLFLQKLNFSMGDKKLSYSEKPDQVGPVVYADLELTAFCEMGFKIPAVPFLTYDFCLNGNFIIERSRYAQSRQENYAKGKISGLARGVFEIESVGGDAPREFSGNLIRKIEENILGQRGEYQGKLEWSEDLFVLQDVNVSLPNISGELSSTLIGFSSDMQNRQNTSILLREVKSSDIAVFMQITGDRNSPNVRLSGQWLKSSN
ncbi:MAG: hypothetical protein R3261_02900 [Alphaproteobacteria bacterium]|nr:hypothetical protein [Alphaproteobacteria bacterium]